MKNDSTQPGTDRPERVTVAKTRQRAARKKKSESRADPVTIFISEGIRKALICEKAYFIAELRGFAPEQALEDWLQAEAEVDSMLHQAAHGCRVIQTFTLDCATSGLPRV